MAGQLVAGELTAFRTAPDGYALAGPADDAELRALLRRCATPGAVRVAFTREPRYAAANGLAGSADYTLVHRTGGMLDGVGRLSGHVLHRNGASSRIGYLGELRLDPSARLTPRMLRGGYARLGEHVAAERLDGCFTSIASDNLRARRVLEHGGRLGLPAYAPLADLVTLLLPVRRGRRSLSSGDAEAVADRAELTAFLERHARAAQLTLTWNDARWGALAVHGLGPADFRVVRERGRIVAAGAVWDLRPFRQTVIDGYAGLLGLARPLVAALARVALSPPLPPPGAVLAQGMIVGAAVDAPRFWPPLLRALERSASGSGLVWLAIARDARDPDLDVLRRPFRSREYHTRLYDVRWPGTPSWPEPWNGSLFRPEVALL